MSAKKSIRDQEALEQRCIDVVDRLIKELDLGWLKVRVSFDPRNEDTERILCEAKSDWEYRQVVFIWNLHQVASATDEELEETGVHELVHALNNPLWSSLTTAQQERFSKLNELATENVARVISHLLGRLREP